MTDKDAFVEWCVGFIAAVGSSEKPSQKIFSGIF